MFLTLVSRPRDHVLISSATREKRKSTNFSASRRKNTTCQVDSWRVNDPPSYGLEEKESIENRTKKMDIYYRTFLSSSSNRSTPFAWRSSFSDKQGKRPGILWIAVVFFSQGSLQQNLRESSQESAKESRPKIDQRLLTLSQGECQKRALKIAPLIEHCTVSSSKEWLRRRFLSRVSLPLHWDWLVVRVLLFLSVQLECISRLFYKRSTILTIGRQYTVKQYRLSEVMMSNSSFGPSSLHPQRTLQEAPEEPTEYWKRGARETWHDDDEWCRFLTFVIDRFESLSIFLVIHSVDDDLSTADSKSRLTIIDPSFGLLYMKANDSHFWFVHSVVSLISLTLVKKALHHHQRLISKACMMSEGWVRGWTECNLTWLSMDSLVSDNEIIVSTGRMEKWEKHLTDDLWNETSRDSKFLQNTCFETLVTKVNFARIWLLFYSNQELVIASAQ
jgi:hypothetical protein